jgi:hypothetical protein
MHMINTLHFLYKNSTIQHLPTINTTIQSLKNLLTFYDKPILIIAMLSEYLTKQLIIQFPDYILLNMVI